MTTSERETYDERYSIVIADKDSDMNCNEAMAHKLAMDSVERERARGKQLGLGL